MRISGTHAVAILLAAFSTAALAGEPAAATGAPAGEAAPDAPPEFTDDLIILKSDVGIEGRVVLRTDDAVKVEVDAGVFWIPRAAIERIEFNLAWRLGRLAEDDYAGRYRLAMEAREMGQTALARPVLEGLAGKEGVPAEIYRTLAESCEAEGELARALEYWKRLRLSRPDDEDLKAKIAELEKKLGVGGAADGAAQVEPAVKDGLETGGKWNALNWGNSVTVTPESLDGNAALRVEAQGGGKAKAVIGRSVKLDLSDRKSLRFNALSGGKKSVRLSVALITSTFYESRPVRVGPAWSEKSFDLTGTKWKSQATKWRYETAVDGLDAVKQVIFLVYNGKRDALLYLDNIRGE